MPERVVLVSCVSEKRTTACPARDLYTSDWFIKAARYASQVADEWYILSAGYGLVHPDQVLEPYNATLKTMAQSAGISEQKIEETKSALRELGLGDDIKADSQ